MIHIFLQIDTPFFTHKHRTEALENLRNSYTAHHNMNVQMGEAPYSTPNFMPKSIGRVLDRNMYMVFKTRIVDYLYWGGLYLSSLCGFN